MGGGDIVQLLWLRAVGCVQRDLKIDGNVAQSLIGLAPRVINDY
jgi:hypothetical protein